METKMKSITAALALTIATLVVTSASASNRLVPYASQQAQSSRYDSGQAATRDSRASFARDAEMRPHKHSTNAAHDVHVSGRYVGSDPDPFIRGMIQQEGILQQR
jgi:hypothetical protein